MEVKVRLSIFLFLAVLMLGLILALSLQALDSTAQAAFPGANGKIVFQSERDSGKWQIYVMNADGTNLNRITNNSAQDSDPSFSPDGTKITFTSDRDGNPEIYSMNVDGSGQTRLTSDSASDQSPDWQSLPQYSWTWYDDTGGDNWILMANPAGATNALNFGLSIDGAPKTLPGDGVLNPGDIITPRYGTMGGPVTAVSTAGGRGIVSQRTLWPKGGNSLEELPGTESRKLSSHFYWPWYDELTPGMTDWVLISNPNSEPVYYRIKIDVPIIQVPVPAGIYQNPSPAAVQTDGPGVGVIQPGETVTSRFPDLMGGLVEVQAWSDSIGGTVPARVMASQRVLSNFGSAFNEVPGIPEEDLSSDYYWTWYDDIGGADWILIGNPPTKADGVTPSDPIYYRVRIGNSDLGCSAQPVTAGFAAGPRYGLGPDGPVEVSTWADSNCSATPARAIVSQRTIWGPSFEEVPGYPVDRLSTNYHWTWYDQAAGPGVIDWVVMANPNDAGDAHVEISFTDRITNTPKGGSYTLGPGERLPVTFGGAMGGPVKVSSDVPVLASQRVLWNGYFNEVLGTVLN